MTGVRSPAQTLAFFLSLERANARARRAIKPTSHLLRVRSVPPHFNNTDNSNSNSNSSRSSANITLSLSSSDLSLSLLSSPRDTTMTASPRPYSPDGTLLQEEDDVQEEQKQQQQEGEEEEGEGGEKEISGMLGFVALEKMSETPYLDFRESMAEMMKTMIMKKKMTTAAATKNSEDEDKDVERLMVELLRQYLSFNSFQHHNTIKKAFADAFADILLIY